MKHKLSRLSVVMLVGLIVFGATILVFNPFNLTSSSHISGFLGNITGHNNSTSSSTTSSQNASGNSTSPGISQTPIGGVQQLTHHHHDDDGGSDNYYGANYNSG